jgi:hypothetical protein
MLAGGRPVKDARVGDWKEGPSYRVKKSLLNSALVREKFTFDQGAKWGSQKEGAVRVNKILPQKCSGKIGATGRDHVRLHLGGKVCVGYGTNADGCGLEVGLR